MSEAEIRAIAKRLAEEILDDADFCWVYEDDECSQLDGEDQERIFDLILTEARVKIG
ncbi:hypothetical protein SEA_SEPHIROTH_107 [Gordonia Phage Sephiroth]|uniref:Uncharacterized protein n=1 Tax=Gordonia Phage Sephiroth TaxID=2767553 RepID=A0A7G9UZI6_9CAUD|nr:hypothetical protein L3Y23_gp124 [Gordonia Phage Sephiroth]QNN99441.1 hypothetical protein SEA_SEPHIROTH_107 [Gordonia Phage Sephiroth]